MRIKQYIKRLATLSLMAASLALPTGAWGQVEGDKYETSEAISDDFFTVKLEGEDDQDIGKAFDGIYDGDGSWWEAKTAGKKTIVIFFNAPTYIHSIDLMGGGSGSTDVDRNMRPESVTVEGTTADNEDVSQRFSLNREERYATLVLDADKRKQYKALRLTLTPGTNDQGQYHKLVMNEITLRSDVKSIQHKPAKWHGMRGEGEFTDTTDTFDKTEVVTSGDGTTQIQATHTYVDTLYVRKGSQVTLWLPTTSRAQDQNSVRYYQRWYNYLTEGTFATGLTGDDKVNDLLTPTGTSSATRFKNGYVGGSNKVVEGSITYGAEFYYPTDDAFKSYTNLGQSQNDHYIVACDLSGYTDFVKDGDTYTEPTLGLRVLYYIVGIDESWETYENQYERLNTDAYKGGGNEDGKKYLEEYEITFPCDHIGNFTNELVSIARQAQFYRIPGDSDGDKLTAKLVSGTDQLMLEKSGGGNYDKNTLNPDGTLTLADDSRAIFFRATSVSGNNTPWSVRDGTTATILVTKTVGETKTTYNIARFKLTFKKNIRLLTQHQVDRLDNYRSGKTTETVNTEAWFNESYLYRTPKYLEENYILLTSRTFDYDSSIEHAGETDTHQVEYYPYPLAWDFSSYAFYDGTKEGQGFDGSTDGNTSFGDAFTEWGSYAIVKDYMGYGDKTGSPKAPTEPGLGGRNSSGYFLYVDASNLPGKLVTLPFEEELCAGSELLISAWVKSAGQNATNTDDAAMLFSIYGIDSNGNRTLIHAQTTGQIRRTTNITTGEGEYTHANGYGSNQNDWYQVFLSFLNDDVEKLSKFKSYEVQIDNNSGSTSGGDFYLDEIKVYVAKPNAKVEQLAVSCEERTLMNIQLAWTRLMARIGNIVPDPGTEYSQGIDFCFIDSVAYEVYRRENPDKDWTEAVKASLVNIGNVTDYDSQFATLYYDLDYKKNNLYDDTDDDGAVLASENPVSSDGEPAKYGFYRIGTDTPEEMALSVDIYTALKQNRRYMILMKDHTRDDDVENIAMYGEPEEVCSIVTSFEVDGRNHIIMNGQVVDPTKTATYCIGQAFTFSVRLTYYDNDVKDYVPYEGTVYFDWFFGNTMQENGLTLFESPNENGVSLEEALHAFRTHYPEEEATEGTDGKMLIDVELKEGDGEPTPFTKYHKDIIEDYLNREIEAAGLNKQLVLRKSELGIRLLEDGLDLAVAPIPVKGDDGNILSILCFAPSFLTLEPNGLAPVVLPGFENMSYTDYDSDVERTDYYPAMRIGLAQIEASSETNPIKVNLRGAKFAFENSNSNHIGLMSEERDLYLVSSNDPALQEILHPADGSEYDRHAYSIGKVVRFNAKPGQIDPDANQMAIYFDLKNPMSGLGDYASTEVEKQKFTPREGYEYRFDVHFEEHAKHSETEDEYEPVPGSCYNYMEITMKVVPEYLVWQGKVDDEGKIDNWNEDAAWRRATNEDIQSTNSIEPYNDTPKGMSLGYVPMLFTKVIIPEDQKAALYKAGFSLDATSGKLKWGNKEKPGYIKLPSKVNIPEDASIDMTEGHPIHYDMMVFSAKDNNKEMSTKPFRVNLCDEIHFEPGAELVNAEYLLYNKAWVDYKLDGSRWYTLASPLQGVVAGDFYTDSRTGKEGSEYFKDIKFNTEDDDNIENNSRFNPSVYQRAWKGNATLVEGLVDDVAINGDDNTTAVKGNWSALYNDVAEPYTPGTGFSLKVQDLASADNKALFRLPKADTEYYYYSHDGTQGQDKEEDISKTDAHRLETDRIMNRKVGENATLYTSFTVPLADEHGDYYLVGNPFMAHLDMKKFFAENSNLEPKYWVVDSGSQIVAVGAEEDLTTTSGDATVAPLQSFFVQKKTDASSNDIKFTQDMQVLGGTGDGLRSANALTITATTSDGRQSRAAVAYSGMASDDYQSSEDAELFLDSNLGDVPMVYTVAGTMATSINVRQNCELVPLGVYGTDDEPVTLRFDQVDAFSGVKLYDAQAKRYTTLTEGSEVSVSTNDYGRYYLTGGLATGSEAIRTVDDISIYSVRPGEIVATSAGSSLRSVRVYGIGGELVTQQSLANQSVYRLRVPGNAIYVVYAEDMDGIIRNVKLRVR
ncbi:MAG TPA: hypothetical protein H9977_12585 [Candidatus Parabacteroides intestinipullorum]|uniref:T9SS C-terminal target domain-containing protein n=1 Tax=Candidatus Parabacteroides intestinipullorum TaxID=2838723 RepID=A0A9D2BH04_9BACT|nr:hypothetical protein [Candidatus Parabacteroides intestinipullorum]